MPVTRPVPGSTDAIAGVLLVQVPPVTPLVLNWVVAPAHMTEDKPVMVPALGLGLMVIVNVVGVPVQPLTEAVTLTVVVNGLKLLFVAVNAAIFPVPFRPKPTFTELVHV